MIGNNYPTHPATVDVMLRQGDIVNENASLLQNIAPYIPQLDIDYIRLSKENSKSIFSSRSRKSATTSVNASVMRDVIIVKIATYTYPQ